MYRSFFRSRLALQATALTGVLGCSILSVAQAQDSAAGKQEQSPVSSTTQISDAQVEANVLKSLAGASDLANQPITTTTVFGVVTLSGSVQSEALRSEAENLVARTSGVQKVVDEMTLSDQIARADSQQAQAAGEPEQDVNAQPQQSAPPPPPNDEGQNQNQAYGNQPPMPGAPEYPQRPYDGRQAPPPPPGYNQPGYSYPQQQQSYGAPAYGPYQQQPYNNQPYGQQPNYGPYQQPYGQAPSYGQGQQPYYGPQQNPYGGQQAGLNVTVPNGALLRIRVNQPLDSGRLQPGERFDGVVVNDVAADGAIAIPRGAAVQGTVIDAQSSGALKGRGELSLQLTSVTLGGRVYPIVSDVWARHGGDKTSETVDKTAVGAGLGGIIGAAAGGGPGAAVGAGVGAAIGIGSSAASGNGQVYVPAEGLLTFHLTQPVTVATVSQVEMERLAQAAGPVRGAYPQLQRRYPPSVYVGPGYYYGPYYPYPYYYPRPYYRYR